MNDEQRPLPSHESRGGNLFDGEGSGMTHWFGTPASEGEFAAGIHSIDVDPRDPKRLRIAISTAGVLESTDGGLSWQGRNKGMTNDYLPDPHAEWGHDAHFIQSCPGAPDHVWQQNHCGVFYSSDGAATWKKVSVPEQGVHFGFPIAADDQDGKTAWVVPGISDQKRMTIGGGLFVARTEDGGESWQQLRKGLPQDHAYDVVYRHALCVRGDRVAFGSTTGNLYLRRPRRELDDRRQQPPASLQRPLRLDYSVRFGWIAPMQLRSHIGPYCTGSTKVVSQDCAFRLMAQTAMVRSDVERLSASPTALTDLWPGLSRRLRPALFRRSCRFRD